MVQNLFIVWLKYNLKRKSMAFWLFLVSALNFQYFQLSWWGCVGFSVRMKYIWTSEFEIWICGKNEE